MPPRRQVRLAKLSRGLPAVLAANVTNIDSDLMHSIVAVEADAVERFAAGRDENIGRSQAKPQFRWRRARRRALSCFGTLSASIRWPSSSASPILPNRFRFGFIRHA